MAKRIKRYLEYVDGLIDKEDIDARKEIELHLKQIEFFMHERLIHLIVMALFAAMTVITCIAFVITSNISLLILALALMVLLIPYIKHYYLLENSVQYMYEQYDRLLKKAGVNAFENKEDN